MSTHGTSGAAQRRPTTKAASAAVIVRDETGTGRQSLRHLFGRDVSNGDIGSLVGAQAGDSIVLGAYQESVSFRLTSAMHTHGAPAYTAQRLLYRDVETHRLVMQNDNITVREGERGQGVGTRIFARQVAALSSLGVTEIRTVASGVGPAYGMSGGYNGYYTWARLGYDAPFSWQDYAHGALPAAIPRSVRAARTIQSLVRSVQGRDWWREHGRTFDGVFDLTASSPSMRALRAYLRQHGIQFPRVGR